MDWQQISVQALALGQVVFINLVLSADNVVVIGLAASALEREQRNKAIFWGIAAATIMRIVFALITNYLLGIVGLTLAGGLLLLWVCWKFWRELEHQRHQRHVAKAEADGLIDEGEISEITDAESALPGTKPSAKMREALMQIIIADLSMSLDNVLGVAGAAHGHDWILISGLLLSVLFMGFAARLFASILERYPIIAYLGLAVILFVAGEMIYEGTDQVLAVTMKG